MIRFALIGAAVSLAAACSYAASPDTLACSVVVNAVKAETSGDCERIRLQLYLTGVPDDTIKAHYPLYVVRIFLTPGNLYFYGALDHELTISGIRISDYSGFTGGIFFKIYTDSIIRSFAGERALLKPAYPSEKPEAGLFPDSAAVAQLCSAAHAHIDTLPSLHDLLSNSSGVAGAASSPAIHAMVAGTIKGKPALIDLLGRRVNRGAARGNSFSIKKTAGSIICIVVH